jgi:hypothetical protein
VSDTPETERKVYGYFVIRSLYEREEVHRMPVHYPRDSRMTEKVERGLIQKVDLNRMYFTWEDADG